MGPALSTYFHMTFPGKPRHQEGPIQADRQPTRGERQPDAEVHADLFQRHLQCKKAKQFLCLVDQISQ